ncbi:hypothetical protein WICANDRAFT_92517, partial [Wickerhamomyces anomalus NRRL Y-366-8]
MLQAVRSTSRFNKQNARRFSSAAIALRSKKSRPSASSKSFLNEKDIDQMIEEDHDSAEDKRELSEDDKTKLYDSVSNLLNSDTFKRIISTETNSKKSLNKISFDEKKRFSEKFREPTAKWITKIKQDLGKELEKDVSEIPIAALLKEAYGSPKRYLKPLDIFESLKLGDAVEMSTALNQNVMAVVIEVPSRDDDPRYTIMNRKGELLFVEKSAFKLRIPGLIPRGWVEGIVEETKYESPLYGSIKTTVDHKFESYFVNPLARRVIMDPILRITNEAWDKLPDISRRLEILHRVVQDRGPKQISLFALAEAVNLIDPENFKNNLQNNDATSQSEYLKLSEKLHESVGLEYNLHKQSDLGREISSSNYGDKVSISHLYAVILALRKQARLWSTSYSSRSAMMPTSVTVNSLEYVNKIDGVIESLKKDTQLVKEFMDFVEKEDYSVIPPQFEGILNLLKEYSVDNITDPVAETVICQLMKNMKNIEKSNITKTHVYDLLINIGYISNSLTNPQHFSNNLCIPGKGVSIKADHEQDYFDLVEISEDGVPDVSESIRKDFGDMRVYCIDSETAHEIDDGVSIEKIDKENFVLHIHIADPSSYLKPGDTVSKIAFERAFTTYQPELVSPMLPKTLSDLCGLGVDGRKTRAITFSVPFSYKYGANLKEAKVQPSYVSNFPKYTYDMVDETLKKTKDQTYETMNNEQRELNDLFNVAKRLQKRRIDNGAIAFGDTIQTNVSVSKNSIKPETALIDSSLDEGSDVLFTKQTLSDSVILVSELMILANSVGAAVMRKFKIPGIFKGMRSLELSGSAVNAVSRLNTYSKETDKLPGLADVVKSIKFVNPAFYFPYPIRHLMLGINGYLPSTSPLRRYGDLVNHWQFHSYLNTGKPLFDSQQMVNMALHIETRNDILKRAQRLSNTFYTLSHIKHELKTGNQLKLSFMVWSRPHDNYVAGMITEFGVFARLALNLNKQPPKIGDVITDFEIV